MVKEGALLRVAEAGERDEFCILVFQATEHGMREELFLDGA